MASSYVPAWDFSGLNSLGDSIASGIKAFRQKQLLSDLGNDLQSGNYAAAAGKAFQAGSLDTGLSLLKLGQQKEADKAAFGALTGSGSSLSPIGGGSSPSGNLSARDAIAAIESKGSGDYSAVGPVTGSGDRAYGRYQVMGNNIGPWTQQALGRALTPQEFLASPEAQNKTFDTIFGGYLQKYGPRDAASMWFTGRPLSEGANRSDVNGMTGNRYVDKFMSAYSPTAGTSTQVADASGAVQASAAQAAAPDAGTQSLMAQYNNVTRALMTPGLSTEATNRLKSIQDNIKFQIEQVGKNRTSSINEYEYSQSHPDFADYQAKSKAREQGPKVIGAGGALVDPSGKELYRNQSSGNMSDDTADFLAERVLAGDTKALIGLGRGAQGAENLQKIQGLVAKKAAERGIDAKGVLENAAEAQGLNAEQRTFGTQQARMASASVEAEGGLMLARDASAAVPRSKWVPINKLVQMGEAAASDPALARFRAANLTLINQYARAINPTGVPHQADKEHAMELLSTAQGPEAYNAVLDQLQREIKIAHESPARAREILKQNRRGGGEAAAPSAQPSSQAPAMPSVGTISKGYRFKGGDPASPSSWEPVQ